MWLSIGADGNIASPRAESRRGVAESPRGKPAGVIGQRILIDAHSPNRFVAAKNPTRGYFSLACFGGRSGSGQDYRPLQVANAIRPGRGSFGFSLAAGRSNGQHGGVVERFWRDLNHSCASDLVGR